jgi:hypothetical protein
MNLFELLGEFIPDWLIRRTLAFVLGFSLMWMVRTFQELWPGW